MMDEVTAVVEVKLSFVVSLSVGTENPLTGVKLKKVLMEHVQNHINAAGGLQPEDLDTHSIIELRNTNDDQVLIGT